MTCVWDALPEFAKYAMGDYTHFRELAQALPCPTCTEQTDIGSKLQSALQSGFGVNSEFAGKLDNAMADRRVRDRVVRLYNEDPAALDRAMDQIIAAPDNAGAIVMGTPLASDKPAPVTPAPPPQQTAPEKPVPEVKPPAPSAPDPVARRAENTGSVDNARLQAQMHMMGAYNGDINGAAKDLNDALREYAQKHPGLKIAATDKDLTAGQLKAVTEAVAQDWNSWTKNKDNAQHIAHVVSTGYEVGARKAPSDAVKEMQIAVVAMGGALPRYGVDGIRWHETNKALREVMAPEGGYTKILDAAGIRHEWPSAKPHADEKPNLTADNVRSGTSSGMPLYFNRRSGEETDPGIYFTSPPRNQNLLPARQPAYVA